MEGKHDELSNSNGFLDTENIDRKGCFYDYQVLFKGRCVISTTVQIRITLFTVS